MRLKDKVCAVCDEEFPPRQALQKVCSLDCALVQSRKKQAESAEKTQKKRDNATKDRLKSKQQWTREAQTQFNRYIRARDYGKPCISSGRQYDDNNRNGGSLVDAGHYRSIGAAAHLRFNLGNCHAQSVKDNRDLSGNIVEYRKGLIKRIGLERVEALENNNECRTFDIEYLKRVKAIFSKRARYYEKRRGI